MHFIFVKKCYPAKSKSISVEQVSYLLCKYKFRRTNQQNSYTSISFSTDQTANRSFQLPVSTRFQQENLSVPVLVCASIAVPFMGKIVQQKSSNLVPTAKEEEIQQARTTEKSQIKELDVATHHK